MNLGGGRKAGSRRGPRHSRHVHRHKRACRPSAPDGRPEQIIPCLYRLLPSIRIGGGTCRFFRSFQQRSMDGSLVRIPNWAHSSANVCSSPARQASDATRPLEYFLNAILVASPPAGILSPCFEPSNLAAGTPIRRAVAPFGSLRTTPPPAPARPFQPLDSCLTLHQPFLPSCQFTVMRGAHPRVPECRLALAHLVQLSVRPEAPTNCHQGRQSASNPPNTIRQPRQPHRQRWLLHPRRRTPSRAKVQAGTMRATHGHQHEPHFRPGRTAPQGVLIDGPLLTGWRMNPPGAFNSSGVCRLSEPNAARRINTALPATCSRSSSSRPS